MAQPSDKTKNSVSKMSLGGIGKSLLGGAKKFAKWNLNYKTGGLLNSDSSSELVDKNNMPPAKVLGEIYKMMKIMEEDKRLNHELAQSTLESEELKKDIRNKEIIKALTGRRKKKPVTPRKRKAKEDTVPKEPKGGAQPPAPPTTPSPPRAPRGTPKGRRGGTAQPPAPPKGPTQPPAQAPKTETKPPSQPTKSAEKKAAEEARSNKKKADEEATSAKKKVDEEATAAQKKAAEEARVAKKKVDEESKSTAKRLKDEEAKKTAEKIKAEKEAAAKKAAEEAKRTAEQNKPQPSKPSAEPKPGPSAIPKVPIGAPAGKIAVIAALTAAGIVSTTAQANILAQVEAESKFIPQSENLNYSADGLANTWPNRFANKDASGKLIKDEKSKRYLPNQTALDIQKNPEKIGNSVYGSRMGNTAEGDGFKYRGRGFIQITGKDAYKSLGDYIKEDLVSNPDLLNNPLIAAKSVPWFFLVYKKDRIKNLNDLENINKVNKAVGFQDKQLKSGEMESAHRAKIAKALTAEMSSNNTGDQLNKESVQNQDGKKQLNDKNKNSPNGTNTTVINQQNNSPVKNTETEDDTPGFFRKLFN